MFMKRGNFPSDGQLYLLPDGLLEGGVVVERRERPWG
jgi:hypothetical protein